MDETYDRQLEEYIQRVDSLLLDKNPQTIGDVVTFLQDTFGLQGEDTGDYLSSAWRDINYYANEEMGFQADGLLAPAWRRVYGDLMRLAKQQILNAVRQGGRRPLGDSYESVRGDGLKAMECSCGCGTCGGSMCGGATKREQFYKTYKVPKRSYSIEELSAISKVPVEVLQQVYNRGIGAYKTNPQSVRLKHSFVKNVKAPMSAKLSKEQWAMSRIYSFLMGGEHDQDLRGGGKTKDYVTALEVIAKTDHLKDSFRQNYTMLVNKANTQGLTEDESAALRNITYVLQHREWAKGILEEAKREAKKVAEKVDYALPEDKRPKKVKPGKPLEPLPAVPEAEDEGSGKKVKFARKHLRGMGIRATKGNVKKLLDAMDVEGVVFES